MFQNKLISQFNKFNNEYLVGNNRYDSEECPFDKTVGNNLSFNVKDNTNSFETAFAVMSKFDENKDNFFKDNDFDYINPEKELEKEYRINAIYNDNDSDDESGFYSES